MKRIKISNNMKNVAKISTGTILGQIISISTLPIFTTIYGAKIIGNWALFNALAVIINAFSDLGMVNALMIEEDKDSAIILYKVISSISGIISIISTAFIYIYMKISNANTEYSNIYILCIIIVLTFTSKQIQICYTWLNRNKEYNILMKNPLINNIVVAIIGIAFGILGYKEYGYYIAILIGQILTLLHMKRYLPKGIICTNWENYFKVTKKHFRFVKYQMPANIIIQIKSQMPTMLIRGCFGAEILGYYSIAMRLLNMPITLLANALGKVFFQHVSELKRAGGKIGELTLKSLEKAMQISFIPMVCVMSFGDLVLTMIFGDNYLISGNILRIMTIYGFFMFLSMSVNGIAIVIEKQQYVMISGILQILGFSLGILIGNQIFSSFYISILLMSLTFVCIQIGYFCLIFKSTGIKIKNYLKPLLISIISLLGSYLIIRGIFILLGIVDRF